MALFGGLGKSLAGGGGRSQGTLPDRREGESLMAYGQRKQLEAKSATAPGPTSAMPTAQVVGPPSVSANSAAATLAGQLAAGKQRRKAAAGAAQTRGGITGSILAPTSKPTTLLGY